MYCVGPPVSGNRTAPLRVSGTWRRAFDGSSESARAPAFRAYLTDLVRPYRLSLREDLLGQGSGQCYTEMAGALLADTVPEGQPVDLLVLAFAVSDVMPGLSSASYLSSLCPGNPLAFAVCDQGSAAPFTGLRLISDYARASGGLRAILVVVEQAALHYDLAAPAAVPTKNAAVTLLCGDSGPGRLDATRQHAGVAPEQAGGLLARELADLSGGRDDVTLVVGAGLSGPAGEGQPGAMATSPSGVPFGIPATSQVLTAPAGQPCTGVWWEFAGGLPGWAARGRRVLLADYDPLLGNLFLTAIDIEAGSAGSVPPPAGPLR